MINFDMMVSRAIILIIRLKLAQTQVEWSYWKKFHTYCNDNDRLTECETSLRSVSSRMW